MPETAKTEKRFCVTIPLKIEKLEGDDKTPFFDCVLEYHNVSYDAIVAIQCALVEMLDELNNFGIKTATAMGLGEKLEAVLRPGKIKRATRDS